MNMRLYEYHTLHRRPRPSRRSALLIAGLVVLGLALAVMGCASSQAPASSRRHSRSTAPAWLPGATPFQKSLHESYADPYDLDKVRHWVMYFLLGEFARRDGPGSNYDNLLHELDSLHLRNNAGRVSEILRAGLAELDFVPDSLGRSTFIDRDVTERAQQILKLHCFKPEAVRSLDELGRLIALHGPCELDTWTETTMIVRFRNGWMYWIGESRTYEHTILRTARERNDLTRLGNKARDGTGEMPADELAYDEDAFEYTDVGTLAESKIPEMRQQRQTSVYVGYLPVEIADVNIHPVPTCHGEGRWNGRPAGIEDDDWNWTRLFVDLYINRSALVPPSGESLEAVDLEITYDVYRLRDSSLLKITSETIPHRQRLAGIGVNDGIVLRIVTLPFFTQADSCAGSYQMDLTLTGKTGMAVRKLPFVVSPDRFELLISNDRTSSSWSGIPVCPRIPTAATEDSLRVVVPVTDLPYSVADGAYVGKLDLYLIDNRDRKQGTVLMGEMLASAFGDTSGATLPVPANPATERTPPPTLIASFDLNESQPEAYLDRWITIPAELADGTRVKRGTYTLGAVIHSGGKPVSEASLNNLRID